MARALAAVLFGAVGFGLVLSMQGCGPSGRPTDFERQDRPLTVTEASAQKPGSVLLVRGSVVVVGGSARMCDALAESFPPQCPSGLPLEGFDASDLPASSDESQGVAWATGLQLRVKRTEDGLVRLPA